MKDLEYTHLEPTDDGKGMVDCLVEPLPVAVN